MNEKRLSSLKLAIINVNYITSSWSETIFKFLFDRISWLFFFWYLHLYKEDNKFSCTSLSVSQSVNLYIHQPTANHVSCYIMTSFYSCLIQTPSSVEQFSCKATSIKCSKNIYIQNLNWQKDRQLNRQKLYPILKTIVHFIHLSVSERYFLLQNHWHQI